MWQPGWEGSLGENGYMRMCGWVPLLPTWNYHNTNQKLKVKKKQNTHTMVTMTVPFKEHSDGPPPAATVFRSSFPPGSSNDWLASRGGGTRTWSLVHDTAFLYRATFTRGPPPGLLRPLMQSHLPSPFTGHPLHCCPKALTACFCSLSLSRPQLFS